MENVFFHGSGVNQDIFNVGLTCRLWLSMSLTILLMKDWKAAETLVNLYDITRYS